MSIAREALLSPIEPLKATDQVITRLTQAITSGVLRPGDQLPVEAELAAQLDVAQMTLRQALSILREVGFIETTRGRNGGSFVSANPNLNNEFFVIEKPTLDELQEITDFRMAIENEAAALAAIRCDRMDLGALQLTLDACVSNIETEVDHCLVDNRFHIQIAEISKSRKLVKAASDIQYELSNIYHRFTHPAQDFSSHGAGHTELLAAIASKDPDRAWDASNQHLLEEHYNSVELLGL